MSTSERCSRVQPSAIGCRVKSKEPANPPPSAVLVSSGHCLVCEGKESPALVVPGVISDLKALNADSEVNDEAKNHVGAVEDDALGCDDVPSRAIIASLKKLDREEMTASFDLINNVKWT